MHRQKLVIRCQMRRWTTSLPMPSTYFELVMRAFGGAPGIDTVLREGTGVTSEVPGAEITLGQQLVQVRNANRLFAPGWGLKLGRRFEPSTHGPVGFAAVRQNDRVGMALVSGWSSASDTCDRRISSSARAGTRAASHSVWRSACRWP